MVLYLRVYVGVIYIYTGIMEKKVETTIVILEEFDLLIRIQYHEPPFAVFACGIARKPREELFFFQGHELRSPFLIKIQFKSMKN